MNMFKKAFTLAEVLVVLTTIGVIAALSLPQLTGGVDDAKYKAGYKKAFMVISNVAGMEKARGKLPKTVSQDGLINFFKALDKNIVVDGYADRAGNGSIIKYENIYGGLSWKGNTFGDADYMLTSTMTSENISPWIIAADGMAYTVSYLTSGTCEKKSQINASTTTAADAVSKTCLFVIVDINGLHKGPNDMEPQVNSGMTSSVKLKKLTGDRYYIYIGSDGVAKGSELLTLSGRILAGEK